MFMVLAISLLVGACDDGSDQEPEESLSGGLTAPGSTLELGETARLSLDDGALVIDIAVTDISEASEVDRAELVFQDSSAYDVYFVRYKFTLVSGVPGSSDVVRHLYAYPNDGDSDIANPLHISRPFPPCQEKKLPLDAAKGTSVNSCAIYVVDKGEPGPVRVALRDSYNYEVVEDDDIEWR